MSDDVTALHVTFSFKKIPDIRDAQIGDVELSGVALETPIS